MALPMIIPIREALAAETLYIELFIEHSNQIKGKESSWRAFLPPLLINEHK